jgi:hypothetical protein
MSAESGVNYLYSMKEGRNARRRVSDGPILALERVSPDGKWVPAWAAFADEESPNAILLVPPTAAGL